MYALMMHISLPPTQTSTSDMHCLIRLSAYIITTEHKNMNFADIPVSSYVSSKKNLNTNATIYKPKLYIVDVVQTPDI